MPATLFARPQGLFDQIDAMHRLLSRSLGAEGSPGTIRSVAQGAFPEINVGRTGKSLEVFVFAPGLDAASIDVVVERNVLKVSGERKSDIPRTDSNLQLYANERPVGRFVRAVSLPEDANTESVEARYKDGILRVTIALVEPKQPQRITVQ